MAMTLDPAATDDQPDYEGLIPLARLLAGNPAGAAAARWLEPVLRFQALNELTRNASRQSRRAWLDDIARAAGWSELCMTPEALAGLGQQGQMVLYANHPFGIRECLTAMSFLERHVPRCVIPATKELDLPSAFDGVLVPIDVAAGPDDPRNRSAAVRIAKAVLRDGHSLFIFPRGATSQFSLRAFAIEERPWQPFFLNIALRARLPLVPVLIGGRASVVAHGAGLINRRLKGYLSASELMRRRHLRVRFAIGAPIHLPELVAAGGEAQQIDLLYRAMEALRPALAAPDHAGVLLDGGMP